MRRCFGIRQQWLANLTTDELAGLALSRNFPMIRTPRPCRAQAPRQHTPHSLIAQQRDIGSMPQQSPLKAMALPEVRYREERSRRSKETITPIPRGIGGRSIL